MIKFVDNIPIKSIHGSVYNPRKITDEAISELQESIKLFGMVKPLIVNSTNSVIIAGHQRKKAAEAIGLEFLPCVFVASPSAQDELMFNLMHNSIETSMSNLIVKNFVVGKYTYINNADIEVIRKSETCCVSFEISKLISKYGEWGSIVCDEEGNILINSEYAYTSKCMGFGVLTYCIPNAQKDLFIKYISKDYGSYNFDNLPIKTYHQFCAQPKRLSVSGRKKYMSHLYEKYIIPSINQETKVVDIGAGRFKYVDSLKSQGYDICGYDPAFMKVGKNSIDIRSIVSHIKTIESKVKSNGLFDVCVLEAVINSVVDDNFENIVLTVCNSLLNNDGVLVNCTRNIDVVNAAKNFKKNSGDVSRQLYYLDENGYSLSVKQGIAYKQKFHTVDSYRNLLNCYFDNVQVVKVDDAYIYCIAKQPKKLDIKRIETALNEEFNIEYPDGYRHNKHLGLVTAVLEKVRERNGEIG